jgi:hypothetical protein
MAKELVELVLEGKKTATASLFWEYEDKPEEEPIVGGYSVAPISKEIRNALSARLNCVLCRLMKLMKNSRLTKERATRASITGARFTGIIFRVNVSKFIENRATRCSSTANDLSCFIQNLPRLSKIYTG